MENNAIKNAPRILAASLFLAVSSSAWSAAENPLDPAYYTGTLLPKIEMTNISLKYKAKDHEFEAEGKAKGSKSGSTFTLYDANGMATSFTGKFELEAEITSTGVLKEGEFSFRSKDPVFGFGKNNWGTVFSGELTALGWSASKDLVEFGTGNFSGWACDQGWCTEAERLWFNTDGFPDSAWTTNWKDKNASGTAVIPVPAAVWLLGSGLIGLLGVGKRKAKRVAGLPA